MIDNPDKINNQELLFKLAEELGSLIIREHQILKDELSQVGVLVEDAVQSLGGNFRALKECVSEQSLKIQAAQSDDVTNLSKFSKQVNSHTSKMTRVLQFDDIVQQLAGHACERIAQMQELFHLLDEKLSVLKSNNAEDNQASQIQLQSMLENITKYRQLLEKANPVKQGSMAEGRIELF